MERGKKTIKMHFVERSFGIAIKSKDMDEQKEGDGRRAMKAVGCDKGNG
jgi:hypothetical protein